MGTLDLKIRKNTGQPWRLVFTSDSTAEDRAVLEFSGTWRGKDYISLALDPKIMDAVKVRLPNTVFSPDLQRWRTHLDSASERAEQAVSDITTRIDIPLSYAAGLYDYQTVGANWLHTKRRGILADAPGLGKTRQCIATADLAGAKRILVLTVNETVQRQWKREIEAISTGKISLIVGTQGQRSAAAYGKARWYIAPVSLLSIKDRTSLLSKFLTLKFDVIIIDEAHMIQGKDSTRGKRAARLKADWLLLATGTPLWNRPQSIWNLLHILDPAKFTSYWDFIEEYFLVHRLAFGRVIKGIRPSRFQEFRDLVAPYILRRELVDVFEQIPEATQHVFKLDMPDKARAAYDTLKKNIKAYKPFTMQGIHQVVESQLIAIPTLRKFCNFPEWFGLEEDDKKDSIVQAVESCVEANKQVLVFTWHKDYAEKLATEIGCDFFHGGVPQGVRAERLTAFREGTARSLVASMASMGVGVDLPNVDVLIFAECDWTPAMIEQAWRRIYRVTSTRDKLILFYVYRKTVEDTIYQVFSDKKEVTEEILTREVLSESK